MSSSSIKYSIIIPTYNRTGLLAKCLDCLKPEVQTLPGKCYDVIVTDDSCQDIAKKTIQENYPWVTWVQGPGKGPAANRNNGAKYAKGEWLIFTDDDCLPDPQWLEAYSTAIRTTANYQVFEGRVYVDRPRKSLAERSPCNESGGYLWSCNFAIHKQLFNELGGFDERFPYAAMEDVEIRLRLTQAGYKFLFVQNASVCHPWRMANGWKQLKQHQISTFIYLSLHPEELMNINSTYYFRLAIYGLLKSTLPTILRFNFRGIAYAVLEHISFLQMVFLLSPYQRKKIY